MYRAASQTTVGMTPKMTNTHGHGEPATQKLTGGGDPSNETDVRGTSTRSRIARFIFARSASEGLFASIKI